MNMNECHWYPRDPQKYLTDTTWCDHATEVAHVRLIDTYYALGKPIVDNAEELCHIGKIRQSDYARVRGNLERLGWKFEKGVLRHKCCEKTMAEMKEKHEAQKRRTEAATTARMEKHNNVTSNVTSNVTNDLTLSQLQVQPQCITNVIHKESALPPVVLTGILNTSAFKRAWHDWLLHLKQKRKPPTKLAMDRQLAKLEAMGEQKAIETLNYCIEKNWQGIFEIPDKQNKKQPQQESIIEAKNTRRLEEIRQGKI